MQTELPLTCGMEFVGVSKVDVLFFTILKYSVYVIFNLLPLTNQKP